MSELRELQKEVEIDADVRRRELAILIHGKDPGPSVFHDEAVPEGMSQRQYADSRSAFEDAMSL